jgi:hypothetical protein
MRRVHVSSFRMIETIPATPPPPERIAYDQGVYIGWPSFGR